MLASVSMSAWIPAPPDGSVAANDKTAGGALMYSGMGPLGDVAMRKFPSVANQLGSRYHAIFWWHDGNSHEARPWPIVARESGEWMRSNPLSPIERGCASFVDSCTKRRLAGRRTASELAHDGKMSQLVGVVQNAELAKRTLKWLKSEQN